MEKLFTYGTLQQDDIQDHIYGRVLSGTNETLVGYIIKEIEIEEEFGIVKYPIITPTENSKDTIKGIVYELTLAEIRQTDNYEGSHYKRVEVELQSNEIVWAYSAKV